MSSAEPSSFQDSAADVIAVIVLIIVPIIAIGLFWLVHILPEKIAEQRHHPQKEAIKVLCLLSLVFGGLLWPFAWLRAYSKPVLHKLAYGRDKHDDYFLELEREARGDAVATSDTAALRAELEKLRMEMRVLASRGTSEPELQPLQQRLDAIERIVQEPRPAEVHH
jgi:CBS domain containing-hemolysin-like protein